MSDTNEKNDHPVWRTKIINLKPYHSWSKPTGEIAYLTHCSFAIPMNDDEDYSAILVAQTWDTSCVICKLLPGDVSKSMKMVFGQTQHIYLSNEGNRTMTLSFLVKDMTTEME